MTLITSGALTLSAEADRLHSAVTLRPNPTDATQVGVGVQVGLNITKTSGMGFSISPGRAAVPAPDTTTGPYVVSVTEAETGTFGVGDASKDRIDVVAIKVDETIVDADPATIIVLQGDYPATGLPVAPTIPPAHLALFSVKISAGQSGGNGGWTVANILDLRSQLYGIKPNPADTVSFYVHGQDLPGLQVIADTVQITTNQNGDATIYLPRPFATNVMAATMNHADGLDATGYGIATIRYLASNSSRTAICLRAFYGDGSAGLPNLPLKISYIAIGY